MSEQQFKLSFVTEEEVAEHKQRRQAEWERTRQPDDPLECPEEETRSLFDQLKSNKDFKERELEAENKMRSSVKGLDDDEAQFLNFVSNRQMQLEKERLSEEKSVIQEMKNASASKMETKTSTEKPKTLLSSTSTGKKTQHELLKGAIKRKSIETESESDSKKVKETEVLDESENKGLNDAKLMAGLPPSNGVAMLAGVLPGIADYNDNDSSTEHTSNSSDSEDDHVVVPRTVTQRVIQEMVQKIKDNCG